MIRSLHPVDLAIVVLYVIGVAVAGAIFARRNRSLEDYFLGGRRFSGWVMGISMLGTSISSISFLAFPAAAFATNWYQLVQNLMLPLVAIVAVLVFIPFLRRGSASTAFEYLQARFGYWAKLYGALSFVVLQLIRLATVLFLVSIPIALATASDIVPVIVVLGLAIGLYTVFGGFEAVVWTDIFQAVVLLGGAIVCLILIVVDLPAGFASILEVANAENKFSLGSFGWNPGEKTFWTLALLGIFNFVAMYATDQTFVQRYIASRSLRDARIATSVYSLLVVPVWVFFFFLGTSVWAFYRFFPQQPIDDFLAANQVDSVFPHFLLTELPIGVTGVVLAGVLAAAMSSLDSSINSISTVFVIDILGSSRDDGRSAGSHAVTIARAIAGLATVVMIAGAIWFSSIEKESMNDLHLVAGSMFGGCLVGLFMVGFFSRRADQKTVLIALAAAIVANVYLGLGVGGWLPEALTPPIHGYWVGILVNLLFVAVAVPVSLLRNRRPPNLGNLTVWR